MAGYPKINNGDVVKLRSGSINMTVSDGVDGKLKCVWWNNQEQRYNQELFSEVCLELAQPNLPLIVKRSSGHLLELTDHEHYQPHDITIDWSQIPSEIHLIPTELPVSDIIQLPMPNFPPFVLYTIAENESKNEKE